MIPFKLLVINISANVKSAYVLILVLLFSINKGYNQNTLGGTFLLATKCRDGTLFMADTRVKYSSAELGEMFYTDDFRKIYELGNYLIGIAGRLSSKNNLAKYYLDRIDIETIKSPDQLIISYVQKFKQTHGTIPPYKIYVAGIDSSGRCSIAFFDNGVIQGPSKNVLHQDVVSDTQLDSFVLLSHTEIISNIKKLLPAYVKVHNLEYTIGDTFLIYFIDGNNNIECLNSCDLYSFNDQDEFLKYIMKNDLFVPIYPLTYQRVKDYLQ